MRKILSLIICSILFSMVILPNLSSANELPNANSSVNLTPDITDLMAIIDNMEVTITESKGIRHVIVTDGEESHEATFNIKTNDLLLDGELVPAEIVDALTQFIPTIKADTQVVNNKEIVITPFANEQGGAGSYKHFRTFNFSLAGLTDLGNLASLTLSSILTVVQASLGSTVPQSLASGAAAYVYSTVALGKIPSLYISIKVYQTYNSFWTGKWAYYIYFYSNSARTKVLKVIYDA